MRCRILRAVAAVLLAAVLLPPALPAEEISFSLIPGERSFASGLWDLIRAVFLGEETGNSETSGPDGATAACDNRRQIDPDG